MKSVQVGGKPKQKTVCSFGVFSSEAEMKKVCALAEQMRVDMENIRNPVLPTLEKEFHAQRRAKSKRSQKKKRKKDSKGLRLEDLRGKSVFCGSEKVFDVVYKQLGFCDILECKDLEEWNSILESCVLGRVFNPDSKRATVKFLKETFDRELRLEKVYRMLDRLYPHIEKVKKRVMNNTLNLFKGELDMLLYDVTTLYFESFEKDDLRGCGFSKDNKVKETQVVLALITNSEGHPVSYELFPGSTSEGKTLVAGIEKLKKRFNLKKVILAADRAMFSEANLKAMDEMGIHYVVAAKLKTFAKSKKEEILNKFEAHPKKYVEEGKEVSFTEEFEYNKRRLIVSYCPRRAKADEKKRENLLEGLRKKIKGKEQSLKTFISNRGHKKFLKANKKSTISLDEEKIRQEALWDGLHGVITNPKKEKKTKEKSKKTEKERKEEKEKFHKKILSRYRNLWKIEEAFRVNKHDLKMRPIYHWKKRRIESHVALCFLTYSVVCTLKQRLKEAGLHLSFKEIRHILKKDEFLVLENKETKAQYKAPVENNEQLQKIYKTFGLTREDQIKLIQKP